MNDVAQLSEVAQRARRRIFRRTMPFLFVLFVIAFLQVDAPRRLPASFVDCSNLFGDQSEA